MGFLGKLEDINALLDFIRDTFRKSPRMRKEVLVDRLMEVCGIPHSDTCHFVEKLQQEGFMYEPRSEELAFIG